MINYELKVRDYFQQAVDYVFERLNDTGYKRLKSGDIKKKEGDLTYQITWQNSRYNYISHEDQSCSLRIISLHASIIHKSGDWLYSFSFGAPKSYVCNFQLFKKYLELDFELLDCIIKDINEIFIPATQLLRDNPKALMESLGYEPETAATDYHYRILLSDTLFEIFGTDEDRQLFNQKKSAFESYKGRAWRESEEYLYLCLHINPNALDMSKADKYSTEDLLKILPIILENIKKDKHYEYYAQVCQYIQNRESTHQELFILTAYFARISEMETRVNKAIQQQLGIDFQY